MDSPVLKYETEHEHSQSQRVEDDSRWYGAISKAFPDPFEKSERYTVDYPEWKDATNWAFRGELPGQMRWSSEHLACIKDQR